MKWFLAMGGIGPPESMVVRNNANYEFWIVLCAIITVIIGIFTIIIPFIKSLKKAKNDKSDKSDE